MPLYAYNNAYYFVADDGLHGTELWRLDPLSQLVRISSIRRQGNDVALSWTTPGGITNVLQSAGAVTGNFADRTGALVAPAGDSVTLNYLDVGGATNSSSRFYRIRLP
jgi:ELWxxDGT repeat protein